MALAAANFVKAHSALRMSLAMAMPVDIRFTVNAGHGRALLRRLQHSAIWMIVERS